MFYGFWDFKAIAFFDNNESKILNRIGYKKESF